MAASFMHNRSSSEARGRAKPGKRFRAKRSSGELGREIGQASGQNPHRAAAGQSGERTGGPDLERHATTNGKIAAASRLMRSQRFLPRPALRRLRVWGRGAGPISIGCFGDHARRRRFGLAEETHPNQARPGPGRSLTIQRPVARNYCPILGSNPQRACHEFAEVRSTGGRPNMRGPRQARTPTPLATRAPDAMPAAIGWFG